MCLCVFLCSAPAVINSKILTVTVRPEPQPSEPMVVVELSPLINVSERKENHSSCYLENVMHDDNEKKKSMLCKALHFSLAVCVLSGL